MSTHHTLVLTHNKKAYNASKAAVKSLAEHLSYDMRGSATTIHLLVPGWTFTGLSGGGPSNEGRKDEKKKQKPDGAWTPSQVADFLKERMDEGKFWYVLLSLPPFLRARFITDLATPRFCLRGSGTIRQH